MPVYIGQIEGGVESRALKHFAFVRFVILKIQSCYFVSCCLWTVGSLKVVPKASLKRHYQKLQFVIVLKIQRNLHIDVVIWSESYILNVCKNLLYSLVCLILWFLSKWIKVPVV